ncbi:Rab11L, rab family GTPase [Emiliania huxleyi CCMP1516]|uniref:Uncharacterized protein n=2 Tax=Emiliania huxleyi TaxID=2903 RepID=A0A0D3I5Z0_EMIH1|nr:ras-related protein [Emiliania huxleyi CCMP1516]XP_005759104.1 Rab11L, rab family GTPase [Emiliania huxleyi CCMP1516]EOD03795.1 ras-related protein [Emiliania huxleyi CCMP1516]EOD06675.1 Rab11L, rab family GTPase [Emiliania huxleyi CCMP1516]|eukprot:XP_005756224.1 ras-related protein [Emiliania huxleyi CCMP1516]
MPRSDYQFKCVLIGDSGVGKTSLIRTFATGGSPLSAPSAGGVDFATRQLELKGKTVEAQMWDTAGMERHRAVTAGFYRGAGPSSSLTSRATPHLRWLRELRAHRAEGEPHLPLVMMLLGTKADLRRRRAVDAQDAKEFAQRHRLLYAECSSSDASEVNQAFERVLAEVFRRVRKSIEAGRCNPDRPAPVLINTVLLTPAQQARDEGRAQAAGGCC